MSGQFVGEYSDIEWYTIDTGITAWSCTPSVFGSGYISCVELAVLCSHHGPYGLCVHHAYTAGLLPAVNQGVYDGDPSGIQWEPAVKGWGCTVDVGGKPCSLPAVYGVVSSVDKYGAPGLCALHADYFMAPFTQVLLGKPVDKTLPIMKYTPSLTGIYGLTDGKLSSTVWKKNALTGWCCTVGGKLGAPTSGCGKPAVVSAEYGPAGLCAEHAEYYGPWLKMAEDVPVGVKDYAVSTGVVPWKLAGTMPSGGITAVAWKKCELGYHHWVCTVTVVSGSVCHSPAVVMPVEEDKYGVGLCEAHYAEVAHLIHCETSVEAPVKQSVLASVKLKVIPVVTKGKSRGNVGVPKSLYFPFTEDYDTFHGKNHSVAPVESIGLNPSLDLPQAACEFYLLMDASLCAPSKAQRKAKQQFDALTRYLASQFSLYISCACLGEARYAMNRVNDISRVKFLSNPKWRAIYNDITKGSKDRYTVWNAYPMYEKRHSSGGGNKRGTAVLLFSVLVHDTLNWRGGGFGGKKWAACGKAVLSYRRKRIDAVSFVDTAFGLKHNGNIVFDKLWDVHGIEGILDANQRGNMVALTAQASTEVVALWKECVGNG